MMPGIWFPLGVGISLSEYAYAALDVALFIHLVGSLWSHAAHLVDARPVSS